VHTDEKLNISIAGIGHLRHDTAVKMNVPSWSGVLDEASERRKKRMGALTRRTLQKAREEREPMEPGRPRSHNERGSESVNRATNKSSDAPGIFEFLFVLLRFA
jgi:hypothetical protein